jgi:hypothetical protein
MLLVRALVLIGNFSTSRFRTRLAAHAAQVQAKLRDAQSSEAMLRQQLVAVRDRRLGGDGGGCFSCIGSR